MPLSTVMKLQRRVTFHGTLFCDEVALEEFFVHLNTSFCKYWRGRANEKPHRAVGAFVSTGVGLYIVMNQDLSHGEAHDAGAHPHEHEEHKDDTPAEEEPEQKEESKEESKEDDKKEDKKEDSQDTNAPSESDKVRHARRCTGAN
jgi:hypothetical protein